MPIAIDLPWQNMQWTQDIPCEPGMVRVKGVRVDDGRGAFLIAIFTVLINSW